MQNRPRINSRRLRLCKCLDHGRERPRLAARVIGLQRPHHVDLVGIDPLVRGSRAAVSQLVGALGFTSWRTA